MDEVPIEKRPKYGLNIYGAIAVNPYKLTILCEEIGIRYHYIIVDHSNGEQKSPWFTKINPNGRLPAIVHVKDDGSSVSLWESAACLMYIASEFDQEHHVSYPTGSEEYWQMIAWLSWQISGQGPMMGQACHFLRYATESVPYGLKRYTAECRRLYHVLDVHLSSSPFVAGSRLTIADISIYIWALSAKWCGVDIEEFPAAKAWLDALSQRPSFQRGLNVPAPYPFTDLKVSNPKRAAFYRLVEKKGTKSVQKDTDKWAKNAGML
ncbi:uncharacterized protein JN550_011163 [Neoarthrinium moseri]|uniref:uncharacterized protein n=1 Tax=Neoarthrinium moseri TaxID=1658444 RepID=UPI001FDDF7BD|nr:uncharacterized protein JN550_011163 [Neoarthrinium moseri]KAI1860848.1 hypothetical protein JN550_011163 [Neoarthrinium moseri]